MERRKILLGSGAALATVLAGCSSDETGDDESNDDEPLSDDGNGNGNGNGNGDDGTDDESESDVPGLDTDAMMLDSEKITIKDVNKDGDEVDIVATTTTTDPDTLRAELQSLSGTMEAAITDPEAFAAEINSVTWVLEHDGAKVMSFYVDVQWAIKYLNGEMSEDDFIETVLATTDDTS